MPGPLPAGICHLRRLWSSANIHHQTFSLGREPLLEPIERLYRSAGRHPERIALHRIGEEFRSA